MTPGLMTPELFWLTLTVIMTGLLWVPYILDRIAVRGMMGTLGNPSRGDKPQTEWATRLMFAHDNAVENLVTFAPLVLILAELDYSTKWTVYATAVYFWARVAHSACGLAVRDGLSSAPINPRTVTRLRM